MSSHMATCPALRPSTEPAAGDEEDTRSSGSGASERGHKFMNAVETKKRTSLEWGKVGKLVRYVKHNSGEA
eukprot:gene12589-14878_t